MADATDSGSDSDSLDWPPTAPAEHAGPLGAGDAVGRFRIERLLGAGGMGRVYAAHDPELDRTIAVKVLSGGEWSGLTQRSRFLREARAMARLRHPNVVTIHDSGESEGRPYIAMELLEGPTLAAWLRAARRPWRAIRDAFVAAGRGLAAAHDAGLVHRDFKPANVVMGEGGVRVLDFGLALSAEDSSDVGGGSPVLAEVNLTRTGALVGTLAYLAPEQLAGARATAASDQWSFCVALYEALCRRLPFTGSDVDELRGRMAAGPTFERAGPPRFLQALLRRGLAVDPAARYPTMAGLLRDLDRDPGRTARRVGAGVAAVGALAAALVALRSTPASPCRGARAHLDGIWDEPARATLHGVFVATGKPFAEDFWERTRARLDVYADRWAQAHTAACESGQRGELSADLLDRRMQCLDGLSRDLGTWVATAGRSLDGASLQKVVAATGTLGAIADCADSASLLARPPRPADPGVRQRLDALATRLEEEHTRGRLQVAAPATQAVAALLPEIEALGYAPLRANARYVYAQLLALSSGAHDSVPQLEAAIRAAADAADGRAGARAWIALLLALAMDNRPDEVMRLELAADAALRRVGSPPDLRRELELALAHAERRKGQLAAARARLDRVLPLYDGADDGLQRAKVYNAMGAVAAEQQDAAALLDSGRKMLAEVAATVGPDNLMTANAHQQLGAALMLDGDRPGALRELLEAVRVYSQAFGPDSSWVGNTYQIISVVHSRAGDLPAAATAIDRSLDILRRIGKPSTMLAYSIEQHGHVLRAQGRLADARAAFEETLDMRRKLLGDDNPAVADSILALSGILLDEKRPAEAIVLLEQALAIEERAHLTGPRLATAHLQLSRALRVAHRASEAVGHADQARGQLAGAEETIAATADLRLAEALWDVGRERPRARTLGEAARARCAGGKVDPPLCVEIDAWLAGTAR